jgi:sugar phosphate isomerase/epimerase
MRNLDQLSINHVTTPRWSLLEAIEGYARAGVRGIGLWPDTVTKYGVLKTRRLLDRLGLVATSYCCGSMFVAKEQVDIAAQRVRNRILIEQAAELGAKCMVCVSGALPA